jgi:acetyltransferase-like isoleucine patch superfamily enzyme
MSSVRVYLQKPPLAIRDEIIFRCREMIEPQWKRRLRALAVPIVRFRYGFCNFGEGSQWGSGIEIRKGMVSVGRYAYIGPRCRIIHNTIIGDLCMIAADTIIFGNDHRYDDPSLPTRLAFAPPCAPTVLEADVWIGQRAMIRAGVRLGRGCVVGAGAVVTRSVPPYAIVVGCPARILKMRFDEHLQDERDKHLFGISIESAIQAEV